MSIKTSNMIQSAQPAASRLSYLPVALFGSVMGLAGLSAAWRMAHGQYGAPLWISQAIGVSAVIALLAQSAAYMTKAISSFDSVRAEFNHPITSNLFGAPLISFLLIPVLVAEISLPLARLIWSIGAIGMTVLAWFIVIRWITIRQNPTHVTPAWMVPVVGMIDIPLAVPSLAWTNQMHGAMVFALSVGLFFAVPLFTILLSRLMFEDGFPDAMQPTLLIMVAPFAVGFTSYVTVTGTVDGFAKMLYMLMLFILAVLLSRMRTLLKCCSFRFSWWAVSFPLAASSGAAIRYASHVQHPVTDGIAFVLLAVSSFVIAGLTLRTILGIARSELPSLSR